MKVKRALGVVSASILGCWALGAPIAQAQTASCTKPSKLGVSMIVDDSASMSDSDPNELRSEGAQLALDLLPDGSVAAAGSFDSYSREFFGPSELNAQSRQGLKDDMYFAAGGNTDFDLGFELAGQELDAMPATVDRKAVIFLSDGEDNDGSWYQDEPIAEQGIPIYTIALGDADADALESIASGDGRTGKLYQVDDSSGLQTAFSDIVSTLTCRGAKVSQEVSFAPGETKEFPFSIVQGDKGWNGIVGWAEGGFDVYAVRPDGTRLAADSTLQDEVYDSRDAFRRVLTSNAPAIGAWKLVVTADPGNAGEANVQLRVYDEDAGVATVSIAIPDQDAPWVLPRRNKVQRGISAVTGTPFSIWVRPYGALAGKVSPGVGVTSELTADGPNAFRVAGPTGTWDFSAESFRWGGTPLQPGSISVDPPDFISPTIDVKDANKPLDAVVEATFARVVAVHYRQEFPIDPSYASLTFTGGLHLQAGANVADATAWAAARVIAALGLGAVSGGSGAAAVAAWAARESTVAMVARVADVVGVLQNDYGYVIDNTRLIQQVGAAALSLVQRLGPEVMNRVKALVRQAVAAVVHTVATAIDRVRNGVLGLFGHSSTLATAAGVSYGTPRRLDARRLTGRPRFRLGPIEKQRVSAAVRIVDRYAPGARVRARHLLVAGVFASGKSIAVGAKLPGAPKGAKRAALLSLQGPGHYVAERIVVLDNRRAAALVKLPRKPARGRWQLSLAAYPAANAKHPRVELAVAEFEVKKR
jgi:hypothetical protein